MERIFSLVAVIIMHMLDVNGQTGVRVFDWQGHRGCRGLKPENSIPAFLHALSFKDITTLELDVVISRDNQVVVSHEPWFNTGICDTNIINDNNLYHTDYKIIRQINCGKVHSRFPQQVSEVVYKPTLREVVESVQEYCHREGRSLPAFNIEIKSQPAWDGHYTPLVEEFCDLVIREFKNLYLGKTSNIQSFDIRALKYVREKYPDIPLAFLVENKEGWIGNLNKLGFTPEIYSPYYGLITKKNVRELQEAGMKVIPWTVNEVKALRKLKRWGVNGVITDYPNYIAQVL